VEVHSTVTTAAQTGVEMEALVAVTAAALTVYDMCKALDKGMKSRTLFSSARLAGRAGFLSKRCFQEARSMSTGGHKTVKLLLAEDIRWFAS